MVKRDLLQRPSVGGAPLPERDLDYSRPGAGPPVPTPAGIVGGSPEEPDDKTILTAPKVKGLLPKPKEPSEEGAVKVPKAVEEKPVGKKEPAKVVKKAPEKVDKKEEPAVGLTPAQLKEQLEILT